MSFKDDKELLENIDSLIYKCCSIKKSLVEKDERDFGERMLLNFGHTLGHAVEKYFDYKSYSHGEAVAIGMLHITRKTEKLKITEEGTSNLIENVLKRFELPYITPKMERKVLESATLLDKKNSGDSINLVLIKKLGEGFIKKIRIDDLEDYI